MQAAVNDEMSEVDQVVRDVGQSEQSSAPTMLRVSSRRKGKAGARMKKDGVRIRSMNGVHEDQCSGAPPFVVPPMQFHVGR